MRPERTQQQQEIDWRNTLDTALTVPGELGSQYTAFHTLSFLNQIRLVMQHCPLEPVNTYQRWQAMGRQVMRGSKVFKIVRPITVKLKDQLDDEGNPKQIMKFKEVACMFPASMTEGEALPPVEPLGWSLAEAMNNLDIEEVPYESFDGNTQGYSFDRKLAINPVAASPLKTYMHEMGHIVLGHTTTLNLVEYLKHRGRYECQAEATAYLVGRETGHQTEADAVNSRAYVQLYRGEEELTDRDIKDIFKATDLILKSGRLAVEGGEV